MEKKKRERSLHLVKRIQKQNLIGVSDENPIILEMSYNSARDELFFADHGNHVVKVMHLHDNLGDLRTVYKGSKFCKSPCLINVCYISVLDTLLLCTYETGPDRTFAKWLVALTRIATEWHEAMRLKIDIEATKSFVLSNSRVLIGGTNSSNINLFSVKRGPSIKHDRCIQVPEEYAYNSVTETSSNETLVAMSYRTAQSVRVYRLQGNSLVELARIQCNNPCDLLWLNGRLLVTELHGDSHEIIELEMIDTKLKRRSKLLDVSSHIRVWKWQSVMKSGLVLIDLNTMDLLHYSLME